MSERALGFIEEWISKNVHAQAGAPAGDDSQAKAYAGDCLVAAEAEGISSFEIEESIEDLTAFMAAAIVEANEREGDRADEPGDLADDVDDLADDAGDPADDTGGRADKDA